MATVTKRRTLVNPGRKRRRVRNLSLKQLLHFGTKKQRANAATRMKNARRRNLGKSSQRRTKKLAKKAYSKMFHTKAPRLKGLKRKTNSKRSRVSKRVIIVNGRRRRRKNVGQILSVIPNGSRTRIKRRKTSKRRVSNTSMATIRRKRRTSKGGYTKRRRRARAVNPRRRRRRSNVSYVRRIKRGSYMYKNPGHRRRRRARVSNRRYHRRRNPGMLSGSGGRVIGILGGAALTAVLSNFIPSGLNNGILGYAAKGAVAWLQGKAVGKITGSRALGQDFFYGGLAYVAAGVISGMFGIRLPGFGVSGMGLIAPSSFYVPQVNAPGSMGQFVRPSMVPAPYVPPTHAGGMGNVRRGGRVR